MISQNIAGRPLNMTNILNNFESFIKQVDQKKIGRKMLTRKRIKIITSEQK